MNRQTCNRLAMPAAILTLLLLVIGCTEGPSGTNGAQPLLFPWEGQLGNGGEGSTVSIVIDSNYIPDFDAYEIHDLHTDRVEVVLSDPLSVWSDVTIPVRSVFPIQAANNSSRGRTHPGSTVTVAFFNLPDEATVASGLTPPYDAQLQVLIDGTPVSHLGPSDFQIVGHDGIPNPIVSLTIPNTGVTATTRDGKLSPLSTLRLRLKRAYFPAGGADIGGVEMTVRVRSACAFGFVPVAASEGVSGTVTAGPVFATDATHGSIRLVYVNPDGMDLSYESGAFADTSLAGTGPFLDLTMNWALNALSNPDCDVMDPTLLIVSDLVVTDVDGNEMLNEPNVVVDTEDLPDVGAHMRRYPVDVPPPPAPVGGC